MLLWCHCRRLLARSQGGGQVYPGGVCLSGGCGFRCSGQPVCGPICHLYQASFAPGGGQHLAPPVLQQLECGGDAGHGSVAGRETQSLQLPALGSDLLLAPHANGRTLWHRYWLCHFLTDTGREEGQVDAGQV